MPDPLLMIEAGCAAAVAAALVLLLVARLGGAPNPRRLQLGWVLGIGAGYYAGCGMLGLWPQWPPVEDRARFLAIVFPAALAIEGVASFASVPRWLAWVLRLALALAVTPILLHQTVYLADLAGPGSRQWSSAQACLILSALAAALGAVWLLLARLGARFSGRLPGAALSLASAAAAVTVMLSGYLSGGQLSVPMSATLGGATLASFATARELNPEWPVGIGVVGLFSVLILGRFFGILPTSLALLLFTAPLLAWIAEGPGMRKLWPSFRAGLGLVLVAIPLAFVLATAQKEFTEASGPTPTSAEPSLQDYLDFGK